jgi:RHS repeat-associated protein
MTKPRWLFYVLISVLTVIALILQPITPVIALWSARPVASPAAVLPTAAEQPLTPLIDHEVRAAAVLTYTLYLPIVARNYIAPAPSEAVIQPGLGGEVGSPDGKVHIFFSPEAVTRTITAKYEAIASPALPPDHLGVAGPAFRLSAETLNHEAVTDFPYQVTIISGTALLPPVAIVTPTVTINVQYTPADVWGLDLSTLFLYSRATSADPWMQAASYADQAKQVIQSEIDQAGEFVPMSRLASDAPAHSSVVNTQSVLKPTAIQSTTLKIALDPDDNVGWAIWPGVGKIHEITYNMQLANALQQRFAADQCQVDVLNTRPGGQDFLSISTRVNAANNFGSDLYTTLAFNALIGSPWGWSGDGGPVTWARNGHPADDALANEYYTRIQQYTGRGHTRPVLHPYPNSYYAPINTLTSAIYSHLETMYLDHNYDWPVIHTKFNRIVDGVYSALITRLTPLGLNCGTAGGPPPLPALPSAEELQQLRDLGYQNYQRYGADPVSFSTGNHATQVHLFNIPGRGGLDFDFTLTYNSQDGRDDLLGFNWSFPYNARLQQYADQSVLVALSDGRTYHFTWNGSNYDAPPGVFDRLEKTSDGWRLILHDQTVLTFKEVIATYSGFGILTEWRDRAGNALHFAYDLGGQDNWQNGNAVPRPPLTSITDDVGRTIGVQSNSDGHITHLSVFDGRSYSFGYTNGDLTSITDANNGTRHYQYDARHRMTQEQDAANILFLQNFYDDRDRVVEQIDATGAHDYLSYDPINRVTTFTDNGGNVTLYHYDEQNRITQVDNANSQSTHDQYDANYNLLQHTDARGNVTQYAYDDRGNLIERHDPITVNDFYTTDVTHWTYNDRNLVTSMTNALSNTWFYEYDANGNLTKSTAPDGSFTTATYNAWGQPTSITDAKGHTTTYIYDTYGNRIQTIDALNHSATSIYDSSGRETSFMDVNGHTVHFTYDGNSNIQQILDPKNHLSTFNYDQNDLLTSSIDRLSAEQQYQYDNNLKLTSERDPLLHWQQYQYDALYRRESSTDALGRVTHYAYDSLGQLITVTDPLGQITHYEYDANGNVSVVIDSQGHRTQMIYDAMNRLKFLIDANGARTEYCYDAEDRLVRTIGPRGEVTDYTYNSLNRLIAVKDPLGKVTTYEYDAVGNRVAEIDPLSNRTDTIYDALNRPIKIEQPILSIGLRPTTFYEYDAVGNTLAITNPRGFVTRYGYDVNDNIITSIDALNGLTQYVYDAEDHLVSVIDANGHSISTTFNLAGLPVATQDALGNTTTRQYDAANNLIQSLDALNQVTTYNYDALNRLVSTSDPLSHTTQYTRDVLGRVAQMLDANAHVTQYGYDPVGRLISVTDALSGTTQYAYDLVGNLTVITDANNHITTFDYNFLNQLKQETNAISNTWRYYYDSDGRLINRVDALWQATYYDYDSDGRLTQVHYGVTPPTLHPITFTYDLNSNETQMCDALGCTAHAYDPLDRNTVTVDWLGRAITHTYDAVGNPIGLTYPNGSSVAYAYDATNRLSTFTDPHGSASQYQRNKLGQITQIDQPNNTRAVLTYDAAHRLTGIDQRQIGASQPQSAYTYLLDAVGNRTQTNEVRAAFDGTTNVITLTHAYQYDPLNRLIDAATNAPATDTGYAFDPVGNRLSKSGSVLTPDAGVPQLPVAPLPTSVAYQYNAVNQLTGISDPESNTALGYNPNGDRVTQTQVLSNGVMLLTNYVYDREDRLTNVTKSISDAVAITATMVATYTYDGYGRRALKDVVSYQSPITDVEPFITSTQVITYLYDGLDIIGAQLATSVITASQGVTISQAITPSWTITESYYYLAPSSITGMRRPVEMERLPNADTGFAGDRYWYQTDGLDSIEALTDESGNLISPFLYDEYGNQLAGNADLQLFTYTAQDFDPETGLIHFYARYYDTQTGTWLSQDVHRGSELSPLTLHRYEYVAQNPISDFDQLGFKSVKELESELKVLRTQINATQVAFDAIVRVSYMAQKQLEGIRGNFILEIFYWEEIKKYNEMNQYVKQFGNRLVALHAEEKALLTSLEIARKTDNSNRYISEKGVQFIAEFEGFRPNAYNDPGGNNCTIGFGDLLHRGPCTPEELKMQISREEGYKRFRSKLPSYEEGVKKRIKSPLTQNQFDALVSFAYNLGPGTLNDFSESLNKGDYDVVRRELPKYVKSCSVDGKCQTLPGLVRRRQAEIDLFYSKD